MPPRCRYRIASARLCPRLPAEVVSLGVTTQKQSPTLPCVLINLLSPDGKYDALYLRNYANIKVKDELARLPGVGQVQLFGSGDYAMRIWLDPDKIAVRGLTAGDVCAPCRSKTFRSRPDSLAPSRSPKAPIS